MPRYTESDARAAVSASHNYSEALRRLGISPHGGNHRVFRRWVDRIWKISTAHFNADAARDAAIARRPVPLERVMVENSGYSRAALKRRLFEEGLKRPECELCGQGPEWRGRTMALVIDHINGVGNDNRLSNLRIVCPNCAATFDTHCGRKNRADPMYRDCERCGLNFLVKNARQRFCSRACGSRSTRNKGSGVPRPDRRKVVRPPYYKLLGELERSSYVAVGRKYGVSDNAVRKWLRQYERESLLRSRPDERAA